MKTASKGLGVLFLCFIIFIIILNTGSFVGGQDSAADTSEISLDNSEEPAISETASEASEDEALASKSGRGVYPES